MKTIKYLNNFVNHSKKSQSLALEDQREIDSDNISNQICKLQHSKLFIKYIYIKKTMSNNSRNDVGATNSIIKKYA